MTEADCLPASWERCKFGDIVLIRNGYAFKSADFLTEPAGPADVPLVRQSQLKGTEVDLAEAVYLPAHFLVEFPNYVLRFGDIIIGMSGSIGHICSYKQHRPALQNQRTGKIELRSTDGINAKFFSLYLSSVEAALIQLSKGMGVQNISSKDIENLPLNLPPLAEQHRIVAKIEELFSELDKGVESLTTAREQLKVYRQGVLKNAFEGKLTANWRTKNKTKVPSTVSRQGELEIARKKYYAKAVADWEQTFTEWQDGGSRGKRPPKPCSEEEVPPVNQAEVARLPVLPSQWTYTRLASIAQIGSGMSVSKQREVSNPISVPYLRVANVQRGRLDLEHLAQMKIERTQLLGLALKKWDVLFNPSVPT